MSVRLAAPCSSVPVNSNVRRRMKTEITPGWRLAAVVAEGEGVLIQGQSPWQRSWVKTSEQRITSAHPTDPLRLHEAEVYDLDSPRSIRFAAGEVSSGVWAFYVPTPRVDV